MANAIQVFKENGQRNKQLETEKSEQKQREEAEQVRQKSQEEARAAERKLVADAFGAAMSAIATKNLGYRITEDFPASDQQLKDDFNKYVSMAGKSRPATAKGKFLNKVTLASTMGPSVTVDI